MGTESAWENLVNGIFTVSRWYDNVGHDLEAEDNAKREGYNNEENKNDKVKTDPESTAREATGESTARDDGEKNKDNQNLGYIKPTFLTKLLAFTLRYKPRFGPYPNLFLGAVAITGDFGAILSGTEIDAGGIFILAGDLSGTYIPIWEKPEVGFSTDANVQIEIGRINMIGGDIDNLTVEHFLGDRFKVWIEKSFGNVSAGGSVALAFPERGVVMQSSCFSISAGASMLSLIKRNLYQISGGFNKASVKIRNDKTLPEIWKELNK